MFFQPFLSNVQACSLHKRSIQTHGQHALPVVGLRLTTVLFHRWGQPKFNSLFTAGVTTGFTGFMAWLPDTVTAEVTTSSLFSHYQLNIFFMLAVNCVS